MKIFLDDLRLPEEAGWYMFKRIPNVAIYHEEDWHVVINYEQFVDAVKTAFANQELIEMISFDHDLADEHYDPEMYHGKGPEELAFTEKTGYDCAKWLVDFCIDTGHKLPPFLVHSMNPVGARNIQGLLDNFKKFQDEHS